jgi:hypothetical protein
VARSTTVLIVGAGASKDYGLPVASELKSAIVAAAHIQSSPAIPPQNARQHADHFCRDLARSGAESVDAFLARRREFLDIGKYAIAAELLPLEFDAVQSLKCCGSWLAWLFQQIRADSGPDWSNLSVVSFNYDRLIELAFENFLIGTYNQRPEVAREAVAKMPIFHVYGKLGWEYYHGSHSDAIDSRAIEDAASGIRIIDEERRAGDLSELEAARKAIWEANRLVFLGFGFGSANLRVVGIDKDDHRWVRGRPRSATATGINMSRQERKNAQELMATGALLRLEDGNSLHVLRDWLKL